MIVPLRLTDEEAARFKKFAQMQNRTMTEMVLSAVHEKIRDESDRRIFEQALAEEHISGKSFSLAHVKKELGIR